MVSVPDVRLDQLAEFSKSAKKIPAAVEFVDIAGLVRGAAKGEGLGNAFLAHIREVDAIAQVVRLFDDPNIIHVEGEVDPLRDIETINLELALADIETIEKRLDSLERDLKRGAKEAEIEHAAATKAQVLLKEGIAAREGTYTTEELKAVKSLHLLTMKPILYVLNKQAGGHNIDEMNDERWENLEEFFTESKALYTIVDANIESELRDLHDDDKQPFRQEYGVMDGGLDDLIQAGYRLLNLISFFTTGADETRAWTIRKGSGAPEAGAAIHSDFRDKFIRAEVVPWDTLLTAGSYAKAREGGLVHTEGKDYLVKDGDVIEFLHG